MEVFFKKVQTLAWMKKIYIIALVPEVIYRH